MHLAYWPSLPYWRRDLWRLPFELGLLLTSLDLLPQRDIKKNFPFLIELARLTTDLAWVVKIEFPKTSWLSPFECVRLTLSEWAARVTNSSPRLSSGGRDLSRPTRKTSGKRNLIHTLRPCLALFFSSVRHSYLLLLFSLSFSRETRESRCLSLCWRVGQHGFETLNCFIIFKILLRNANTNRHWKHTLSVIFRHYVNLLLFILIKKILNK